jgi:alpha-glucuronidase
MSWDGRMSSGRTLWDELVWHYHHGADEAQSFAWSWAALSGRVDPERHAAVQARLRRQAKEAAQWSDRILRYFQTFSGRPFPSPTPPPGWIP